MMQDRTEKLRSKLKPPCVEIQQSVYTKLYNFSWLVNMGAMESERTNC